MDRLTELERKYNDIKNDIDFLNETYKDTRESNMYNKFIIEKIKEECIKNINDYRSLQKLFKDNDEIMQISRAEYELAKKIYDIILGGGN